MADYPHMPLATDAYLGDTKHLRTIEHGAYLLLLICAWRTPGVPRLPNDDKLLARYAGVNMSTWRSMRDTVMGFWDLGPDGYWTQKKQLKVRDRVTKKVQEQREKSFKRWGANPLKNNETGVAVAMPDPMHPNPNLLTKDTPIVPKGTKRVKSAEGYGDDTHPLFAEFATEVWAKRWTREGHSRFKAYASYSRLNETDRAAVRDNIVRCARQLETERPEAKFRPMLQTWINSRGWESDAPAPADQGSERDNIARWVAHHRNTGKWNPALGPEPGQPGCRVPPDLLITTAASNGRAA